VRALVVFDGAYAARTALHDSEHPVLGQSDVLEAIGDAGPVAAALQACGHTVEIVPLLSDVWQILPAAAQRFRPDFVFNLCDTLDSQSRLAAAVPAILDTMGIPYVGAGVAGLTITKRKHDIKALLVAEGLPTPRYQVIRDHADLAIYELRLVPPVILKLTAEHASVGIAAESVCWTPAEIVARATHLLREYHQPVLIEEFVDGRELYVSIAGDPPEPVTLMEHQFAGYPEGYLKIRTFDAKWFDMPDLGGDRPMMTLDPRWQEPVPYRSAPVPWTGRLADITAIAVRAFHIAGCRDWGRIDLRLDRGGVPMIIDVTPNTYLGPSSPCAKAAAATGLDYTGFVARIAAGAIHRANGPAVPTP
jgi:D-alanine-D-alanine ligase